MVYVVLRMFELCCKKIVYVNYVFFWYNFKIGMVLKIFFFCDVFIKFFDFGWFNWY